jgi:hypothetical protein
MPAVMSPLMRSVLGDATRRLAATFRGERLRAAGLDLTSLDPSSPVPLPLGREAPMLPDLERKQHA